MFKLAIIAVLAISSVSAGSYGYGAPSGASEKYAHDILSEILTTLPAGDHKSLEIIKIKSATTQVVSGSLDTIECELKIGSEIKECTVKIWHKAGRSAENTETTFKCNNSEDVVYNTYLKRSKRQVLGGVSEISKEEGSKVLETHLSKLAAGTGPVLKVKEVTKVTSQVVAGTSYKITALVIDADGKEKTCDFKIWVREWIKVDGIQITVNCPTEEEKQFTLS